MASGDTSSSMNSEEEIKRQRLNRDIALTEEIRDEQRQIEEDNKSSFLDFSKLKSDGGDGATTSGNVLNCSNTRRFNPISIGKKLFFVATPAIWATINHKWFNVVVYFMLNYINFIAAIIMYLTGSAWYWIVLVLIFTPMTIVHFMKWMFNDPHAFPDEFLCSIDENSRDELLHKLKKRADDVIDKKKAIAGNKIEKKPLLPNFLLRLIGEKTDEELAATTNNQTGGGDDDNISPPDIGGYQKFDSNVTQADIIAGATVIGAVAQQEIGSILKYGGILIVLAMIIMIIWYLFRNSPASDKFIETLKIRFGIIDEDIQKDLAELD